MLRCETPTSNFFGSLCYRRRVYGQRCNLPREDLMKLKTDISSHPLLVPSIFCCLVSRDKLLSPEHISMIQLIKTTKVKVAASRTAAFFSHEISDTLKFRFNFGGGGDQRSNQEPGNIKAITGCLGTPSPSISAHPHPLSSLSG